MSFFHFSNDLMADCCITAAISFADRTLYRLLATPLTMGDIAAFIFAE